jgi:tetratricopeptide (TPR) repeat protein
VRKLRRLFLIAVTVSLARPALAQKEKQWEWSGVSRIVAVGDVHGAFDNFAAVLKNAGLVDDNLRWIGGKAHLVQNGDVVDRGPHSRQAMDLLMQLEKEAARAGGAVHALIGNHEAMNIVGILDLTSKEEYDSYTDRDSRGRREATFERYYESLWNEARERGEEPPKKAEAREDFEKQYPLGFIEHRQAFAASGRYGKWIREHNTSVMINGVVFSHGDWSEKFSQIGIAELNRRVRAELSGKDPLEGGLAFDSESPLQYRGLANVALTRSAQQAESERVSRILGALGARRLVVGHTVTSSGVIESRFGGKHVSIDTGMLELYRGGHRIALEIEDDTMRAVHDEGKVAIPEVMDESSFDAYLLAVAAVDPENVDVQLRVVDSLENDKRTGEAAAILERLLAKADGVPFRYRELMGTYYESRGEIEPARREYLAYIHGLRELARANPDNLNLANLLVRFCIDKKLELELAEQIMNALLERSPANAGFLLTRARLHLAQTEFRDALTVLDRLPEEAGTAYEIRYMRGLAHLGLGDRESARAAFEKAIAAEPDRQEAREELRKLDAGQMPHLSSIRPRAEDERS